VRRENEDEASFTQRNSSYLAAKAACQQAIAKTQQQASAAKEKAALERLTSETGKTLQDAPTWLSKLGQGQQQRADEALTLGLASVGIAPFVLANPDFKAALKEVALCGKGYVIPHRAKVAGPLLRTVHQKVVQQVADARAICEQGGVTLTSDGVTSLQKKPLINVVEVSGGVAVFVKVIDASGHIKDGKYIAGKIVECIMSKPDPRAVVAVCMDNATRSAWPLIEQQCPWLVCIPCTAHVLDLLLEDICKLPFCKEIVTQANKLRMFLQNKTFMHYVYTVHATHQLQNPGATRFRQHYIMLMAILREEDAIYSAILDKRVKDYVTKNKNYRSGARTGEEEDATTLQQKYNDMKGIVEDADWWLKARLLCDIMTPIAKFQALVDGNAATASKAYFNFYLCQQAIEKLDFSAAGEDAAELHSNIVHLITKRWEYFETPLTLAGYALDPEYMDCDTAGDDTVMNGLFTMIDKTFLLPPLPDDATDDDIVRYAERTQAAEEAVAEAHAEYARYKNRTAGIFNRKLVIDQAAKISAYDWWFTYGSTLPNLRQVALRVLAQPCSSSSAERGHKDLAEVVTKKRTRMGFDNVEANLFIRMNRRKLSVTQSLDFAVKVIPDGGGWDDDSDDEANVGDDGPQPDGLPPATGGAGDPGGGGTSGGGELGGGGLGDGGDGGGGVAAQRRSRRLQAAEAAIARLSTIAPGSESASDDDAEEEAVDAWADARQAATDDGVVTGSVTAAERNCRNRRRAETLKAAAIKRRAPEPEAVSVVPAAGDRVPRWVRRPARLDL
jgi:hypothetical protein